MNEEVYASILNTTEPDIIKEITALSGCLSPQTGQFPESESDFWHIICFHFLNKQP